MKNAIQITISELGKELNKGIVIFSYLKKDGTHRLAHGTLNNVKLSEMNVGISTQKSSPKVFTYYDTEANGWRCFSRELNDSVVLFSEVG